MSKLRKAAKGRPCMVRIPGICNHNPETVVLAHIRKGGVAGVGMKPPDLCGVWACSDCHDAIDGRKSITYGVDGFALNAAILDALCRTLAVIEKEGIVK